MLKISPEDWREVFALLDTALELPVNARDQWLASLGDRPAHITTALHEVLARQTNLEEDGTTRAEVQAYYNGPAAAAAAQPPSASEPGKGTATDGDAK